MQLLESLKYGKLNIAGQGNLYGSYFAGDPVSQHQMLIKEEGRNYVYEGIAIARLTGGYTRIIFIGVYSFNLAGIFSDPCCQSGK